jgi:hypothetical protein
VSAIDTDHFEAVVRQQGLKDGSAEMSRKEALELTQQWIRQRIPAAIVRFGEGEGRLLVADPDDAVSMKVAANKMRRQTGLRYSADDVLAIKRLVTEAFDAADVVGIRGSANFNEEHLMWVERISQVFEARLAQGREPAYVTHCLLNNTLRDALGRLLEGQRYVSVISSRDLKATLQTDYGVEDVQAFQVPSQYVMRAVDGEYERALHGVPIWPDHIDTLRDELAVRQRGEIFLVGAGLFGKELCIRIRDLGGIALDMGSCLDGMANKVTRGPNRPGPYRPPAVP